MVFPIAMTEWPSFVPALAGVVITGLLGLLGYVLKSRLDLEKAVRSQQFDKRLAVYRKALDSAFDPHQTGCTPSIAEIGEINKELLIVGSPEVVRAFNRIADTDAGILKQDGKTPEQIKIEQSQALKDLANAIRTDLYPHQKMLRFEDIRFIHAKKSGSAN